MQNRTRSRILIYEGIPGAGKTTLRYEYGKMTSFVDLTIDRFTPTQWVFSNFRNDSIDRDQILETEELFDQTFDVVVIWCYCSPETAYQRCQERGDELDPDVEMLEKLNTLYGFYFLQHTRFSRVILIDNSFSLEDSLSLIKSQLEGENAED